MKIVDINTGKTIEEFNEDMKNSFFTTKEYWENYKRECKEFGDYHEKEFLYGKFIKNDLPKV